MRRKSGFTLTETIVSIFLLSLVVVFVMNLYPSATFAVRRGEQSIRANSLAQSFLDQARSRPFSSLLVGSSETGRPQAFEGTLYRSRLEIFEAGNQDYVKGLRVAISWEFRGKKREVVQEIVVHSVGR